MNKQEAIKIDYEFARKNDDVPFYIDEENGIKTIFGISSGFAYSQPMDPNQTLTDLIDNFKESNR